MSGKRAEHRLKRALVRAAKPGWRRCVWAWPLGHSYRRGRWAWQPTACEWCGRPVSPMSRTVHELIEAAEQAAGVALDAGLVPAGVLERWRDSK